MLHPCPLPLSFFFLAFSPPSRGGANDVKSAHFRSRQQKKQEKEPKRPKTKLNKSKAVGVSASPTRKLKGTIVELRAKWRKARADLKDAKRGAAKKVLQQ
jgi:transcription antitermination factor NusG